MIEGTVDAEGAFALAAKDLDPVALLGVTESVKVADVGDRVYTPASRYESTHNTAACDPSPT